MKKTEALSNKISKLTRLDFAVKAIRRQDSLKNAANAESACFLIPWFPQIVS